MVDDKEASTINSVGSIGARMLEVSSTDGKICWFDSTWFWRVTSEKRTGLSCRAGPKSVCEKEFEFHLFQDEMLNVIMI